MYIVYSFSSQLLDVKTVCFIFYRAEILQLYQTPYIRHHHIQDNIANPATVVSDDDREVSDQTKAECSEKDDGQFQFTDLGSSSSV